MIIGVNDMEKCSVNLREAVSSGRIVVSHNQDVLKMTNLRTLPTERWDKEHLKISEYIELPDKLKMPFVVDMEVMVDAPGFYFLIGDKGHINFATMHDDNRRIDDLVDPKRKIKFYDNRLKINEFNHVRIIYDYDIMKIIINDDTRYESSKERYMQSKNRELIKSEDWQIRLTCDKMTTMQIKNFEVTTYENTSGFYLENLQMPEPITRHMAVPEGEKATFDACIKLLPEEVQQSIRELDEFVKKLKHIKFKRKIDRKGQKISYFAPVQGISYHINLSNELFEHTLQWYLITNGPVETWHRKSNDMEDVIQLLSRKDQHFANRMTNSFVECFGCTPGCLAVTPYSLNKRTINSCHGKLKFHMSQKGIGDVQNFMSGLNEYYKK